MRRWNICAGEILESRIEERKHHQGLSPSRYYKPIIKYKFNHKGQIYTGSRFTSLNFTIGSKEEAQETINKYSPGAIMQVYFDPANPTKNILTLPDDKAAYVSIFIGCFILFITILFKIN